MWPVYCCNFESQSDFENLFSKYGRIERIVVKEGFAFVYFEDKNDAEAAIRGLDGILIGHMGRRLHVDWGTGAYRHRDGSESNARPNKKLFVIHYDPVRTRDHDIKSYFEHYGKVLNVTMRRNYAFVDFETQEDATEALKRTHRSKIFGRTISVGYAFQDDDDKHNGRCRNDAPLRSSSPAYRHDRASPDYGRYDGHSHPYRAPSSHVYDKHGSPSNSRARRPFRARASHVYDRNDGPSNPKAWSPSHARASPVYGRYEGPSNPRARSPYHVRASPVYDKYRGHES